MYNLVKPYYEEPHRHYHNMDHINFMLDNSYVELTKQQHLAILFHDIVYIPNNHNNEELSVKLMRNLIPDEDTFEASLIIMNTVDHIPTSDNSKLVSDLDMLSIGLDYERFENDTNNIRKEFSHLSDKEWRRGRCDFLVDMYGKDRIFHTDYYHERYEKQAKENITRAISEL